MTSLTQDNTKTTPFGETPDTPNTSSTPGTPTIAVIGAGIAGPVSYTHLTLPTISFV